MAKEKTAAVVEAKETSLSTVLTQNLMSVQAGLPKDFSIPRFVNNSIALLNGNETLVKFCQQNPKTAMSQVKAGLMQGAYLGLDFMSSEAYLVPYGATLQFQMSYKGARKIVKKYSIRPVKDIYAEIVREGDLFEIENENGKQSFMFKPVAFSNKPVVGAFAVCVYEDGDTLLETMNIDELNKVQNSSKAKNSPAWSAFPNEMRKKVVMKRLCKKISIEFDTPEQTSAYQADEAIETDVKEIVKQEIAENANQVDFSTVIEAEAQEVVDTEPSNYEAAPFIEG